MPVYCELSKKPCASLKKLQLRSKKPAAKFSDDRFKTFDGERLSSRPYKEESNVQERINNKVASRYAACNVNKNHGFERNDNFGYQEQSNSRIKNYINLRFFLTNQCYKDSFIC